MVVFPKNLWVNILSATVKCLEAEDINAVINNTESIAKKHIVAENIPENIIKVVGHQGDKKGLDQRLVYIRTKVLM